jgi:anti-anti-sigma factor
VQSLADLQFASRGNAVVARVSGELDVSNAEDIGTAIARGGRDHAAGVVLDLTELNFLDSVGICVILGLREQLVGRGRQLALVVPQRSVIRRTVGLVGLTDSVPTEATIDGALRILARHEPTEASE